MQLAENAKRLELGEASGYFKDMAKEKKQNRKRKNAEPVINPDSEEIDPHVHKRVGMVNDNIRLSLLHNFLPLPTFTEK